MKLKQIFSLLLSALLVFSTFGTAVVFAEETALPKSISIADGSIVVSAAETPGYLTVTYGADRTKTAPFLNSTPIVITGSSTANTISVGGGLTAAITLQNVSIAPAAPSAAPALSVAGGSAVSLTLSGANSLTGGAGAAAISAGAATLTVQNTAAGGGSLAVSAGAGGVSAISCGTLALVGGSLSANSGAVTGSVTLNANATLTARGGLSNNLTVKSGTANVTGNVSGKLLVEAGTATVSGTVGSLETKGGTTTVGAVGKSAVVRGGAATINGGMDSLTVTGGKAVWNGGDAKASGITIVKGGELAVNAGTLGITKLQNGGKLTLKNADLVPTRFVLEGGSYSIAGVGYYKAVVNGLPANTTVSVNGSEYSTGGSGSITLYLPAGSQNLSITDAAGNSYPATINVTSDGNATATVEQTCKCSLTDFVLVDQAATIPDGQESIVFDLHKLYAEGSAVGATNGCTLHSADSAVSVVYTVDGVQTAANEHSLTIGKDKTAVKVSAVATFNGIEKKSNEVAIRIVREVALTPPASVRYGKDIVISHNGGADFKNAVDYVAFGGVQVPADRVAISDTGITISGKQNTEAGERSVYVKLKDGSAYTLKDAAVKVKVENNIGVVQQPASITGKRVGASFTSLGLPAKVKIVLDGESGNAIECAVKWDSSKYRSSSTSRQTITGTIQDLPSHVTLNPDTKEVKIYVTLKRSSSSGGSNEHDYEYEFWSDVLDRVKEADSGDTIYVKAGQYDNMPASILEELKGRKVTLIIEPEKGKDITIYGKNVKSVPASRISYTLTELAKLYKDGGSSSSSSSSSSKSSSSTPTWSGSVLPSSSQPAAPVTPSSSSSPSSSEEESSSESSSEEEQESSEEELGPDVPTDTEPEEPEPEEKKMSPLVAVIGITVAAAALSGIIACIVLRRRQ